MILITGGTGSFGHAFVERVYGTTDIRVFSRDEEKQRLMAGDFPDIEYVIGDVRDPESVRRAMRGVTRVFHAAALKQVPSCEDAPIETIRTNAVGTDNVCAAACAVGARVVGLSTDKAVEPIGVMGASKMLAESITTTWGYNVVRYGNVIGSRGSIVPIFRRLIDHGQPITITDGLMTRFLITLDQALDPLELAMDAEPTGTIYVKRSPAATVTQIVRVLAPDYPTKVIGVRPGEKRHELLIAEDESAIADGDHFRVTRNGPRTGITYSSDTAPQLSDEELAALLAQAPHAM